MPNASNEPVCLYFVEGGMETLAKADRDKQGEDDYQEFDQVNTTSLFVDDPPVCEQIDNQAILTGQRLDRQMLLGNSGIAGYQSETMIITAGQLQNINWGHELSQQMSSVKAFIHHLPVEGLFIVDRPPEIVDDEYEDEG